MSQTSRALMTPTAVAALLTLTACGGGQAADEPPALSKIQERMWDAMQDEGSVTITADLSMLAAEQDDATEIFGSMLGDLSTVTIYGELDGSATAVGFGDDDFMRVFGQDEAYLAGDAMFSMIESFGGGAMDESEQEMFEAMAEEFAGTWINFSDQMDDQGDDMNISELFGNLRDDWGEDGGDAPLDLNQLSDEAVFEQRDGVDVWVYAGQEEGQELVLEANHDAPKILEMASDGARMTFSEWGNTTAPEPPAENDVIDEEEMQQRMMQHMLGDLGN